MRSKGKGSRAKGLSEPLQGFHFSCEWDGKCQRVLSRPGCVDCLGSCVHSSLKGQEQGRGAGQATSAAVQGGGPGAQPSCGGGLERGPGRNQNKVTLEEND